MSNDFINDAARKLFANEVDKQLIERVEKGVFPENLWLKVNESGFTKMFCKEEDGGSEASWEDAYPVFFNLGYYQVPAPVAETAVANLLMSAASVAVDTCAPIAIHSAGSSDNLVIDASAPEPRLTGTLRNVKWARFSDYLLLRHADGQLLLVDLKGPGVNIIPDHDISTMPADGLSLDNVVLKAVFYSPFPDLHDPVRVLGAAARAMMIVGALEFALDQSVQYAKDRVQFGKPIGKNQAIQQQLAFMAGEVAVSRAASYIAAKDLPNASVLNSPSAEFSVAAAKVCAGEAADNGAAVAHQVHGAIGFTYEHPLNFATRRLWSWRGDFGNAAWWARKIGAAYARQGGDAFWANLTDRVLPS